uniref:Uncharacterized protein n=1 Tax=Candidatus Kentrum sp. TUN TaxID=2126343 RepID=A0A451APB0_9GAMM|nr:MAG: hypothetical protein BECKTUN1418F_GA0071002_10735 [Candidatus Kentron sp. TUN]VFK62946.1 MAG: hypothetical protein BECKTUN1418D_GA0071000_11916 [Candidatus Kentron sp. TUN]VFK67839.1 MAG: hypothetical protein BECKTUN1418E_GA0071001_11625 [Candidatus Kentron sp. TUN]
MTIDELIPSIIPLSDAEKIRLVQAVLQQLAHKEGKTVQLPLQVAEHFDPKRFYGVAHHSRQDVDQYVASAREGWN